MVTAARDRLARMLRGDTKSAFSVELMVPLADLGLEVEGLGRSQFPVTPAKARKLISIGQPARFGRGEETLTDPDVRDTWEIPRHLVRADWNDAALKVGLATIREELGLPNTAELTADLHSLLVYETGQFFLAHQDTEKSDDMIGTLVVTLPSSFAGGELVVRHNEEQKVYRGSKTALSLVAFYADCRHEVRKVTSGYRITLTYNLLCRGDSSHPVGDEGIVAELISLLHEHFSTSVPSYYGGPTADPPNRLVYLLDHEYTPRALERSRLKGDDAGRVSLLRAAADKAGCEVVLALADIQETHEAYPADEGWGNRRRGWYDSYHDDDDENDGANEEEREYEIHDLINSEVTVTHWVRPDGAGLEEISLSVPGTQVCASTSSGGLTPYSQEYEGYMGNWGNTLDRWYHRAAVAVWPQQQAFANRAETSPAWALDQLAAMAASGDVAGARAAAATLAPFWKGTWRDDMPGSEQDAISGLLGKALRAGEAVADAATAKMLLRPFRVGSLTSKHMNSFVKVAGCYGQEWAAELLETWFGGNQSAWDYAGGSEVRQWTTELLPGFSEALRGMGTVSTAVAHQLLGLAWERIGQNIRTAFALSGPSHRDEELNDLGKPLAAVLAAVATLEEASTRDVVTGFIRQQDDAVTVLEMSALRTFAGGPRHGLLGEAGLDILARDCAERLRARLARPAREAGDWSIGLPIGSCTCGPCVTLRAFLGDKSLCTFEWPLAKDGRQHIHSRIDGAELPVTHITRRQGRPYTLVLTKTDALFTSEEEARARDEADLAWLTGTWRP